VSFHTEIRMYTEKSSYNSPDMQYIYELIKFTKKNDCKLYFITTPHHRYYKEQINPNIWAENQEIIKYILQNNYYDVKYINFFDDERFSDSDFDDQDHLNISKHSWC